MIGFSYLSQAQIYPPSFYKDYNIDSSLNNTLSLRIENSNFLKNNEYFNDIIQGYTLIGWFLNPKLTYYPVKNAKIEAGVHFLKYSGIENFTQAIPTLSFQYKAGNYTNIILGTLYGSTNHQMIEPIFRYEYYFTDNVENGLQFLFDTKIYKGDIWINWQQFIFKGDDSQEIFTFGLSNKFILNPKNETQQFYIPIQIIFVHQGGQINETSEKLITINNSAFGIGYSFMPNLSFIDKISAEQYYVAYNDMSTTYQSPYIQGFGLYSKLDAKLKNFNFNFSWWYSNSYISKRGHPVFQSLSTVYNGFSEKQRALISSKINYEKNIVKGLDIGVGFESYFDLYSHYADYWYMFYINFNRDFFIKRFK
ncbi:MAG: hypothetical protein JXR51_15285 [Bacteroidales bacterium]|nr:hypothetical protein [Bacteroidales bacterium]MBN2758534.1 hypothetical protein [Bacteroidales bacterium]